MSTTDRQTWICPNCGADAGPSDGLQCANCDFPGPAVLPHPTADDVLQTRRARILRPTFGGHVLPPCAVQRATARALRTPDREPFLPPPAPPFQPPATLDDAAEVQALAQAAMLIEVYAVAGNKDGLTRAWQQFWWAVEAVRRR